MREFASARNDHEQLLFASCKTAARRKDRDAAFGLGGERFAHVLARFGHDIDHLCVIDALHDAVDDLCRDKDRYKGIERDLNIAEHAHGKHHNARIHKQQQTGDRKIRERAVEQQAQKIRAAGGRAAHKQKSHAGAAERAAEAGREQDVVRIVWENGRKQIDEQRQQNRCHRRARKGTKAELAPRDDHERHV